MGGAVAKVFGIKKPKPLPAPAPVAAKPEPTAPTPEAAPPETQKPATTPPSRQDAEVVDVGVDTRRDEKRRRGRASTVLAGSSGTLGDANIGRKTLLGS